MLEVEPRVLRFGSAVQEDEGRGEGRETLRLRFAGPGALAFKLQTNASKRYNVLPAQGYIAAGETVVVVVQFKAGAGWSEQDKFLIRAIHVDSTSLPVSQVWESAKEATGDSYKVVVRCEFHHESATETRQEQLSDHSVKYSEGLAREGEPEASRYQIDARQRAMLVKNLSTRPEDKLSRAELEELQMLRQRLGQQRWDLLQEQARLTATRDSAPSPKVVHSPRNGAQGMLEVPAAGPARLADLLAEGVTLLQQHHRAGDSSNVFLNALELTRPHSVERAQVLVGLGAAHEAAGLADRALECYTDALCLYSDPDVTCTEPFTDLAECKASLSNAIANVHSDMRDHAMAAAWFELEIGMFGSEPKNGERIASIRARLDRELNKGSVTPGRLAAARGQVRAALATPGTAPATRRFSQQSHNGSVDSAQSSRSSPPLSVGSPTSANAWQARHKTAAIGTMWKPSSASSPPADARNTLQENSETSVNGSGTSASARRRNSALSTQDPTAAPRYLSSTSASRSNRVDSLGSLRESIDHLEHEQTFPRLDGKDRSESTLVDPVVVERRNRAAAALHVSRAIEARRKRDQMRGVNAEVRKGSSSLLIVLEVSTPFSEKPFSIGLPGPLNAAMQLTVREMRERVSFVTGVELSDFELAVDNVGLSDSWTGRDIGLGERTHVDLHLLPGTPPDKYSGRSNMVHGKMQNGRRDSGDLPATPRRPPPLPVPSLDSHDRASNDGDSSTNTKYPAGDQAVDALLLSSLERSLQEHKRVSALADDLGRRALELLGQVALEESEDAAAPPSLERVGSESSVYKSGLSQNQLVWLVETAEQQEFLAEEMPASPFLATSFVTRSAVTEVSLLPDLVADLVEGATEVGYVFSVGGSVLFAAENAVTVGLVSGLFARLEPTHRSTKARALAIAQDGQVTDLLHDGANDKSKVTVFLDSVSGGVKTKNAVAVKVANAEDFSRLFKVLVRRTSGLEHSHLVLLLENELHQRRLFLVQSATEAGSSLASLAPFITAAAAKAHRAHSRSVLFIDPAFREHAGPLLAPLGGPC